MAERVGVARTIADLSGSDSVRTSHLAEASSTGVLSHLNQKLSEGAFQTGGRHKGSTPWQGESHLLWQNRMS
jgi:hypothetical protein